MDIVRRTLTLTPLGKKEIILNNQDVLYFEGELVLDQIIGSFNKRRI